MLFVELQLSQNKYMTAGVQKLLHQSPIKIFKQLKKILKLIKW